MGGNSSRFCPLVVLTSICLNRGRCFQATFFSFLAPDRRLRLLRGQAGKSSCLNGAVE